MDVPSVKKPGILLSDTILTISLPSSLSLPLAHIHILSLSLAFSSYIGGSLLHIPSSTFLNGIETAQDSR